MTACVRLCFDGFVIAVVSSVAGYWSLGKDVALDGVGHLFQQFRTQWPVSNKVNELKPSPGQRDERSTYQYREPCLDGSYPIVSLTGKKPPVYCGVRVPATVLIETREYQARQGLVGEEEAVNRGGINFRQRKGTYRQIG